MKLFSKKKNKISSIPPMEQIVEELYDKSLSFCDYDVIKVTYNKDKTKRFVLLKSHNGFYKYTFEEIYVFDEDEWSVCCNIPGHYPAYWSPNDRTFAYSFFGTEDEALSSMTNEPAYLQYFK